MNKKQKLWKRCISLLICLVMTAKLFAGMGMEVEAAEKKIVLYKASSGIRFTDGSWINRDIDMIIYDDKGNRDNITWKAGSGDTTELDKIVKIEFLDSEYFSSDGIDPTNYYVHPTYNTQGQHSIIVWPACKLNITVVDYDNKPVANQPVTVKWGGTNYGTVTTDSQGKATHWKVRSIASDVTVSTTYDGRIHTATTGDLGDSYDITLRIPKIQTVDVNLKNANGELLKGAMVNSGSIRFTDSDNNGTYTADLEVGKSYDISAYVAGYDTKVMKNVTISEGTSSVDMTLDASLPAILPTKDPINLVVGGSQNVYRFTTTGMDGQGVTYTSEVENSTIASYDGSKVTGLKAGSTNLYFHAVTGNVKRTVTIPITVSKVNPTATVTPATGIIYDDYKGNFTFRSNAAGAFAINGKSISVNANTDVTKKVSDIITGNPNIGNHYLSWTFTPTDTETYNTASGVATYAIDAKDITNIGTLSFTEESKVYDGTEKTVKNLKVMLGDKQLIENTDFNVLYTNNVNAGQATVTVTGIGNYKGSISKEFNIRKATLSVTEVTAEHRAYDGTTMVKLTNVVLKNKAAKDANETVVDLANAKAEIAEKNVGTYKNVSNVTGICLKDTNNYTLETPSKTTVLAVTGEGITISKKPVTIEDVVIESSKIYDGSIEAKVTSAGSPSVNYDGKDFFVVEGTAAYIDKNVGKNKTVEFDGFKLAGDAAYNYKLISQPASQTAEIVKKELRLEADSANVRWKYFDGTNAAEFEGNPTLVADDIVSNDDVSLATGTTPIFNDIGSPDEEREIKVNTNLMLIGADAANYSLQIPEVSAMIKNYTAEKGRDYQVNSNTWMNQDFVIRAGENCYIAPDMNSSWQNTLTVSCGDNQSEVGTKTFYVKYPDGKISSLVKEEYKIDKIAPMGTVTFTDAETSWTSLVNPVTFDLYYKDAQEVLITAVDQEELSGVASIEWYESLESGMAFEDVQKINEWKVYEENQVVSLEDTKKFVYYVKITDNAGNITYLSTDGAVYDTTNPAVLGITDNEIYYTTQKIAITDTNLKEVTLNGDSIPVNEGIVDSITLNGNEDAIYTLVVTDKAGNVTTVTVTMKTIAAISETIKDLTVEKVTGDNADTIKAVEDNLAGIDDEDATTEEKQAIKDAQSHVDALQKVIEDTAKDVKQLEDTLAGYEKDSIKSSDEEAIDQLIRDVDEMLKDENLSKEQKEKLEEALKDTKALADSIDQARETFENAKASVKDINKDNVSLENEEALEKSKQTLEDIVSDENDNYTKEEKESAQEELSRVNELFVIVSNANEVIDKNDIVKQSLERIKNKKEIPDNKEIVEKAVETKLAYDALNEKEKELVGVKVAQQIEEHYKKAIAFKVTKGMDGIYTKNMNEGLSFTANGAFALFKEIRIDGTIIDTKYYKAKAGSTIVELKPDYLDTLKVGKHTFEVVYDTLGEEHVAACNFTIAEEKVTTSSKTGDDANAFGWMAAMIASAMAFAVITAIKRRKFD